MTDAEWWAFRRRMDRQVYVYGVVLGVILAACVLFLVAATNRPAASPAPPSMRCFPVGTELPETVDFLGNRNPGLPGCIDYRLNEGMET